MKNVKNRFEFTMPFNKSTTENGYQRINHLFDLRIEGVGYWNEEGDIDEPTTLCSYDIDGIYLNKPHEAFGKENIKLVVEHLLDGLDYSDIANATHAHVLGYVFASQHEELLLKYNEIDMFTQEND